MLLFIRANYKESLKREAAMQTAVFSSYNNILEMEYM